MGKVRASVTGLGIAFILAACGSATPIQTPAQGGTPVGTGGGASGGEQGNPTGGAGGNATGGAVGGVAAGTGGSVSGGMGPGPTGGAGGVSSSGGGGPAMGGVVAPSSGGVGAPASGGAGPGATGGNPGSGGLRTGGISTSGGSSPPSSGGNTATKPKFVSSAQNDYWKEGTWTEVTSGTAEVTVTDATTYQTWSGFGGTFNEAGWDVLSLLSAADRDRAMKLLFDASAGANFAFGRIPIGASDYAMDRYSLNETAGDYAMDKFSIDRDKQKLIPYIKAALAIKSDIHFWGSPWTPPTWMKTGTFTADGKTGWDGGDMKDDAQILKAHAIYLSKFVEKYGEEGIKIEAVHPQNEPGYATRYPSCLWTPALMNKFIGTYLGPTFAERNVAAQIYLGTMSNNDSGKDGTIVTTVTGDATSMKYVKGFGLQWNMEAIISSLTSRNLPIVQTEHKCGNYPWNPGGGLPAFNADKAQNDHPYAVESWGYIKSWITKGVHVYSAWNMVLDTAGKNLDTTRPWPQNALLTVDRTAKTLTVTPVYYVFRHLSQFVDPGAKRVATSGGDALAFKNPDGSIVAVLYNSGAAKSSIVAVGGKKLQVSLPANGWATVNWR